jgi:hypothetical protein
MADSEALGVLGIAVIRLADRRRLTGGRVHIVLIGRRLGPVRIAGIRVRRERRRRNIGIDGRGLSAPELPMLWWEVSIMWTTQIGLAFGPSPVRRV